MNDQPAHYTYKVELEPSAWLYKYKVTLIQDRQPSVYWSGSYVLDVPVAHFSTTSLERAHRRGKRWVAKRNRQEQERADFESAELGAPQ